MTLAGTRGTRLPAGLGFATVLPDIDFETCSEAGYHWGAFRGKWHGPPRASQGKKGLFVIGACAYAQHPSTDVLCFAYDLKDGAGPQTWSPGEPSPWQLFAYIQAGGLIEAHNSAFEYWIWNCVCVPRYGWPPLPYWQLRCSMAKARAASLPGALDKIGEVLRLDVQKDKQGKTLLDKFSVPRNPTKADPRQWHTMAEFPAEARALVSYNVRDIEAEAAVSAQCPDLEGEELDFWLLDQLINRRGVAVDVESLRACADIVEQLLAAADAEIHALTRGTVERCSQLERLKGWLGAQGVPMGEGKGSGDDEAIQAAIDWIDGPGCNWQTLRTARRALVLRQMAGSASVKKVFTMVNMLGPDGRLHDLYNYHGAHTGRPTGEGPQPTNLFKAGPDVRRCLCGSWYGGTLRACPWCNLLAPPVKAGKWTPDAVEDALAVIRTRSLAMVQGAFGDALLTVAGCLRGLFVAGPGQDFVCSDFSSIEGVVTACLAGEDWRVEMFATHGKAYELSVSKITGTPFADIMRHAGYDDVESPGWWLRRARKGAHHPLRQTIGKVAELASGFGGWIGAWVRFGADAFMSEDDIKAAILAWRAASPNIVHFWGGQTRRDGWYAIPELFGLEGMAIAAIQSPGRWFPVLRMDGTHTGVAYLHHGGHLYCQLPSGRHMTYRNARVVNQPDAKRANNSPLLIQFERWNTNPLMGAMGWVTTDTYSGKLCENVVQAVARDIQRGAMLRLERAGYAVALHVYDEDVCEVPRGWGTIEGMEALMSAGEPWATYKGQPWPIKASGGWRAGRYMKAD